MRIELEIDSLFCRKIVEHLRDVQYGVNCHQFWDPIEQNAMNKCTASLFDDANTSLYFWKVFVRACQVHSGTCRNILN